ncbi:MAG: hypothetical protein ACK5QC_16395 [Bacteroidota bacterium]|nr:hypothetical protein [Bacteroidota bacterium]MCA6443823.1 hypothetical protein [Bacteroidota bacterium]
MKLLGFVCFLTVFFGCGGGQVPHQTNESTNKDSSNNQKEKPFFWIEGVFKYTSNSGEYTEIWRKINENEYIGKGYFIHLKDTAFLMNMALYKDKEAIKMLYDVKGQNDGKKTEFLLTKQQNKAFTFENPFRDFPSVMRYSLEKDSIIDVFEWGFVNGKEKIREYSIKRIR